MVCLACRLPRSLFQIRYEPGEARFRPGYDAIVQAMCGLMSINGDAASGPTRIGTYRRPSQGYTALTGTAGPVHDRQFQRFCKHVGLPWRPIVASQAIACGCRVATNCASRSRVALAPLSRESLCQAQMRQGAPMGTVNTVPQAFQQAHVEHRGMQVEHADYRGIGVPTKLSRTPGHPGWLPRPTGSTRTKCLSKSASAGCALPNCVSAARSRKGQGHLASAEEPRAIRTFNSGPVRWKRGLPWQRSRSRSRSSL